MQHTNQQTDGIALARLRPNWSRTMSAVTTVVTLSLIIATAIITRTLFLGALGYNSDEAVYAGQGAAIAQIPVLNDLFPVFRAHPLLFQFLLAIEYKLFGMNDLTGRLTAAAIGVITVLLVFRIGDLLYGRRAGLYAALFMALMPYHTIVSRQVLLDGPMTLFSTLALYTLVRFAQTERSEWLIATGAAMGLTFLSKETGILMLGAVYAFLALTPSIRTSLRAIAASTAVMLLMMAVFPLTVKLSGGGGDRTTGQYLIWQLFRRPNHEWSFYPTVVPPAIGLGLILLAVAGLWLMRHQNDWREKLLVAWIVVPLVFFELWPTKGFQYLLPIAPAVALLAARTAAHWHREDARFGRRQLPGAWVGGALAVLVASSLLISTLQLISPRQSDTFLAGSGGIPGALETGAWITKHSPEGSTFLAIGPSMANIVKYYGHRDAYGLSVSPNPLHRNPSYEPILNPDSDIRTGDIQYLVWDSYSAERTTFFSEKLLWYVNRYNGRVAHTESVSVTTPDGNVTQKPVIIIYEVHP